MIRKEFDPSKRLVYACYLRMSDDDQNPRSPDQQKATIDETRVRQRYNWSHVVDYRDDAISGRFLKKRPGFQQMLKDIRTGKIKIDAILVDTLERLARSDELPDIRKELYQKYGVVVLAADTNFADPNSVTGKTHATFEALRATEDNRIKAHNVLRGKKDAVRLKHWPGGPTPFGTKRKVVLIEKNGCQEVDYSVLVPDRDTDWIVLKAFRLAHDNGWGSPCVAQSLNDDKTIPERYKPFSASKLDYWFKNTLYKGVFKYGVLSTDIIKDSRVTRRNPVEEVLHIPDFCEAIVPPEVWDAVAELRQVRRDRARKAYASRQQLGGKQIAPLIPGVALKYLLSGLVRCGECGRRMVPNGSKPYTTASGETKRYVSHMCPARTSGGCENRIRIPEALLRQAVIDLIRRRLFPTQD